MTPGTISSINISKIAQEKRGEKSFYNGVDITELTRRYSRDKWIKIKDLWPQIQAEKDKKASPKEVKHKSPRPADKRAKAMKRRSSHSPAGLRPSNRVMDRWPLLPQQTEMRLIMLTRMTRRRDRGPMEGNVRRVLDTSVDCP